VTPADLDVFKKTRRCLQDALKGLNQADGHALSSPDRLAIMHQVAQSLRQAAHDVESASIAEHQYNKTGFAVYQLDFEGAATPVLVG
jgi:hypothetical protein